MFITPLRFTLSTAHWKSSLQERAVDAAGNPVPWYSFPAVEFLDKRDFSGLKVLEFGGGQSTLWWARRAARVVTIEEDEDWYNDIRERMPQNVTISHIPVDRQTRDVSKVATFLENVGITDFDVIAIDGHLRIECGEIALPRLKVGGALILDNSEGYGFREFTVGNDLQRVDFYGFAGGAPRQSCTSISFRDSCFLFDPKHPLVAID